MVLKLGDVVWHLHFHRSEAESDESRALRGLSPLLWDFVTSCTIHTGPCVLRNIQPRYCINGTTGIAKCSKRDQFVKRAGAKLALSKALRLTTLDKKARKALWDAYWARTRRPKERSDKFLKRVGPEQAPALSRPPKPSVQPAT
jgi:hypothetical protein